MKTKPRPPREEVIKYIESKGVHVHYHPVAMVTSDEGIIYMDVYELYEQLKQKENRPNYTWDFNKHF